MNYSFKFGAIWKYQDQILEGIVLTLQLSIVTMIMGLAIGLLVALAGSSPRRTLRLPAQIYVEAIRNTPLLVQLFIVFFGLPSIGIKLGANTAAVIALTINMGAYGAEIIRAGIESVRRHQIEAGRALGLTAYQTFRHVVLFQAMKAIYPSLASQFVLLMLATSIVSAIGASELFHQGAFIESRTYRSFEVYTLITLTYLLITLGLRTVFAGIYWVIFVRRPVR
ncbi:amino acid ABC transporter permease [Oceaniovalibus sp. ACAM 378]|uniref:amino acid ABC transporter permease n=1 Tax=Oceaniovalibus sp. ACAM 378 TaxID=2599923 RepID=UPI0011D31E97|nr:amino acid ABC transporter permease [Oceaniovalibus sp. ACAM 378]TYB86727.1 amino acid ABC transporter permease [Oceaniovalibus sp. ACAM 378]